jgi:transcription antitermination factor NusG
MLLDMLPNQLANDRMQQPEKMVLLQTGDHVTVNSGAFKGRKGIVVQVQGKFCKLYDQDNQEELEVFSRDCSDAATDAISNARDT